MDPLIPISTTKSYFILDAPIPEILLMIIYIDMFHISCIHSFVFPSWKKIEKLVNLPNFSLVQIEGMFYRD